MTTQTAAPSPTLPETALIRLDQPSDNGFWSRLRRLPRGWVGAGLVALVVFTALFAPIIAPADPLNQFRDGLSDMGTPLPPSARFPLGTDHLGRDVLSRALYGARISLMVSLIANLTAAVFGTLVGVLAGYFSGALDFALMRFVDVLLAFPSILLALGLAAVFKPSVTVVIAILSIITWPTLARLVRGQVLSIREREFVQGARAVGASDFYIIVRHIIPHTLTITVIWATLSFASLVLVEASLSFLGVGVPPPSASWGNMVADGQSRYRIAPWMILVPTFCILITTLGFNLLGDAVRDALDPRTSIK